MFSWFLKSTCFLVFSVPVLSDYFAGNQLAARCLHKYLERDFLAISAIIFPNWDEEREKNAWNDEEDGRTSSEAPVTTWTTVKPKNYEDIETKCSRRNPPVMHDGGEPLMQNCKDLFSLEECYLTAVEESYDYGEFFSLRSLWVAIREMVTWLCGAQVNPLTMETVELYQVERMRTRFLELIESLECLECARKMTEHRCEWHWKDYYEHHVWSRLLRLELDPSACPAFTQQFECTKNLLSHHDSRICGPTAQHLFGNLTDIFLRNWCYQSYLISSSESTHSLSWASYALIMFLTSIAAIFSIFGHHPSFNNFQAV